MITGSLQAGKVKPYGISL